MALILWIIAAVLVIAGIITLISGSVIWGIVLIVVGLLVGPGGVSISVGATGSDGSLAPDASAGGVGG